MNSKIYNINIIHKFKGRFIYCL